MLHCRAHATRPCGQPLAHNGVRRVAGMRVVCASGSSRSGRRSSNKPSEDAAVDDYPADSGYRHAIVRSHFPKCLGVDDFIDKVEAALYPLGFTGDNSIAVTNLCRDEATAILRDKIEDVWGSSFNITGLGGVLTCGQTGFKAGFSHAPVCGAGRERYVFFSFPHIGIDEGGEVGAISRPGRPKVSHACGALIKALGELRREGVALASSSIAGVHDLADPEYSILKACLARRMRAEHMEAHDRMTLVDITDVAERAITGDLEKLIAATVDRKNADYAVITGVQIHNWASDLDDPDSSSYEFVSPGSLYAVVGGKLIDLDLGKAGPPARQKSRGSPASSGLAAIPGEYLTQRLIGAFRTAPGGSNGTHP